MEALAAAKNTLLDLRGERSRLSLVRAAMNHRHEYARLYDDARAKSIVLKVQKELKL